MAEVMAWPLNLETYAYNAEDVQRWMAGKTSGIYGDEGNCQVIAKSGRTVTVKLAGHSGGWLSNKGLYGVCFWGSSDLDLEVDLADGISPRIDRVVVSWHVPGQAALPTISVRKGIPSAVPLPPELVNNGEYVEICLAEISMPAGAVEITSAQITDTRLDEELCGIVSMGIEKIPTDGLNAQFQEWFSAQQEQFSETMEEWDGDFTAWFEQSKTAFNTAMTEWDTDFNDWFALIQDQLTDTDVGQIMAMINSLTAADVGAVPETRKVNGKALSADIDLTAADVGADPSGAAAAVQANLNTHASNTTLHTTAAEKTKWNTDTVHTLNYTKSGTVHQLTGLSGLTGTLSCVFKATAAFAAGDTVTVDGTAYTVQLSNGEDASDNLFVSGATVPVVVDVAGKKVNFKGAGGGGKLPADWEKIYTYDNTSKGNFTFKVPVTGKYRVTVVGAGGYGGSGGDDDTYNSTGGGGGSGGWCRSLLSLTKDQEVPITVNNNAQSSFGNYLSATRGQSGSSYSYVATGGTGGTASGGNEKNYDGNTGGGSSSHPGGSGAYLKNYSESPFLQHSWPGEGGTFGNNGGNARVANLFTAKFAPFGSGGGGGADKSGGSTSGGQGGGSAVIIEFVE